MDNNYVEKTGKTVDEALKMALEELGTEQSNVNVEILDEGTKGIFGLIGNKLAKVKVSLKAEQGEKVKNYLEGIISRIGLDAQVRISEDEKTVTATVLGNDVGVLIGRRGETLDALQYLTSLSTNKEKANYKKVIIDSENYRQKREETLEKLADKLADRVVRYKKSITLEPMNPYERRVIHAALQNNSAVKTYSIGDEPNRKVVIALK